MAGGTTRSARNSSESGASVRPWLNLGSVLLGILVLLFGIHFEKRPAPTSPVASLPAAPVRTPSPGPPPMVPVEETPPPKKKTVDRAAVARAEEALDAASRDRARADARADEAARRLSQASTSAALAASASRTIGLRVRDPSYQISRASARGGFLRAEREKLKGEIVALARTPRPKAKSLVDTNPVAKPLSDDEFHFEVRHNRVSFIELERLLDLVKKDAMLRIRLSENARLVESQVGPVGAFSLHYVMGRSLPAGLDSLVDPRSLSYDLRGWEIVPQFEGRGETYETASRPISEYSRAVNRLTPGHATITMWVYPDGFGLFRKLRDDLHARGFMVAARPLPEGMAIRGSPAGSLSAGQ
jgi:hypothetical protein